VAGCDVTITLTCSTNSSICSPPASREKSAAILDGKNCTEAVFLKFTLTEQCFALIVEQISANLHHFVLRADGLWNFYGTRTRWQDQAAGPSSIRGSGCVAAVPVAVPMARRGSLQQFRWLAGKWHGVLLAGATELFCHVVF